VLFKPKWQNVARYVRPHEVVYKLFLPQSRAKKCGNSFAGTLAWTLETTLTLLRGVLRHRFYGKLQILSAKMCMPALFQQTSCQQPRQRPSLPHQRGWIKEQGAKRPSLPHQRGWIKEHGAKRPSLPHQHGWIRKQGAKRPSLPQQRGWIKEHGAKRPSLPNQCGWIKEHGAKRPSLPHQRGWIKEHGAKRPSLPHQRG